VDLSGYRLTAPTVSLQVSNSPARQGGVFVYALDAFSMLIRGKVMGTFFLPTVDAWV